MFELKISGIYEASRWVTNGWATHVISLVDPSTHIDFKCDNHLILKFHDVESQVMDEWVLPSEQHVDAILEFTKNIPDNTKLLVHCHQGLSRSTAAAIGVMLQKGMDPESAYLYVESVRDILLPNGLITQILDDKFQLNGALVELVMSERKKHMQKRMDVSIDANSPENLVAMKKILESLKGIG